MAGWVSMTLFSVIVIYHLLIILQVIPYTMTWGGRLESVEEMYRYESSSLALNFLFIYIVYAKMKRVARSQNSKAINILLWLMVALFMLNTFGNVMSLTSLEAYIFTPVTFIISILCARLAIE